MTCHLDWSEGADHSCEKRHVVSPKADEKRHVISGPRKFQKQIEFFFSDLENGYF